VCDNEQRDTLSFAIVTLMGDVAPSEPDQVPSTTCSRLHSLPVETRSPRRRRAEDARRVNTLNSRDAGDCARDSKRNVIETSNFARTFHSKLGIPSHSRESITTICATVVRRFFGKLNYLLHKCSHRICVA